MHGMQLTYKVFVSMLTTLFPGGLQPTTEVVDGAKSQQDTPETPANASVGQGEPIPPGAVPTTGSDSATPTPQSVPRSSTGGIIISVKLQVILYSLYVHVEDL